MNSFSPVNLNPKKDQDALAVLLLSCLVLFCTGGLVYLYLLFKVYKTARETPAYAEDSEAVYLVFGKRLNQNQPDAEFQKRLFRLLDCPFREAILMGGYTAEATLSEAQAGYNFLKNSGRPVQQVHLEQNSRNTLENLKNTRQLLNGRCTVIISNRYHLARCSLLAGNMKIRHVLCAAEPNYFFTTEQLVKYLHEAFYLHWFLTGKYWAQLTKNQRMLNKIS